jgi:DNA-binding response OmpR family regulator
MTVNSKHILIVEDDVNLGASLKKICESEGFQTTLAPSLAEARNLFSSQIDLVVLDWMLSDGQGIDFLKEIRRGNQSLPIIMLTARTELIDKVIGLESGSNDYMTKPFESRELVARIRVQLREKNLAKDSSDRFTLGRLTFDTKAHEFFFDNKKIALTKMEYDLLKLLAENPRQTFSRENLLDKVWGYENFPTTRTVDNHVLQIRQKTADDIIETIRGLGYRLGIVSPN